MSSPPPIAIASVLLALGCAPALSQTQLPPGYWPEARSQEILQKTETLRLAPGLGALTASERAALTDLLQVGTIVQQLYEDALHPQAATSLANLQALHEKLGRPRATQNLLDLFRLNRGPIATTLDNAREAFLPVAPQVPGRNRYPPDATREQIDAFLAAHPDRRGEILGERTVVRRAVRENLEADIKTLGYYSLLRELHPGEIERLRGLRRGASADAFYAVAYPIAYPAQLTQAYSLLMRAAATLEHDDAELARYLRHRALDLLTNDYEAGDASWVTGRFRHLNVQLGAYETYDDALYGVKAFDSMSVMLVDEAATADVRRALGGLQAIEDALPYENRKRVRDEIPVGVYRIIADYGQARGINTATILPNDALFTRRYGRTILLRENIMKDPVLFADSLRTWQAATLPAHAQDLTDEGNFQRTLWHEIGHYLGPDRDRQGRTLDVSLEDYADAVEEMKSDLVSLFALQRMNHPALRSIQASGIRRTLQNVKPRSDQPYQTMQLVQFNWFLDQGLLAADKETARLKVNYERYPAAVSSLLTEVLRLQATGGRAAVATFFERWTRWTPELHERLAARIRDAQSARFRIVRYEALGE